MNLDFLLLVGIVILGMIVVGQAIALSDLRAEFDQHKKEAAESFVLLSRGVQLISDDLKATCEHVSAQEKRVISFMEKTQALCAPIAETIAKFSRVMR